MADLGIKARGPDAAVRTLSGGNQQKVLLARWLRRPHRVMLLDEPTRGIDVGAKVEIYSLINRLAERGVAVVLASSELPEIIGMADRIAVLRGGRIMGTLDNRSRNVTQEQVMQLAAG
jgi:ABC-type sugar transport system ATPase subunit